MVTGMHVSLEVAHIFPFAPRNTNIVSSLHFLTLLRMFCGKETATRVEAYLGLSALTGGGAGSGGSNSLPTMTLIKGSHPINRLENLITMTSTVHSMFGNGVLVLEPLGDPLSIFDSHPVGIIPDSSSASATAEVQQPQLTSYRVVITALSKHCPPNPDKGWDLTTAEYTGVPLPRHDDPDLLWNFMTNRGTYPTSVTTVQTPPEPDDLLPLRSGIVLTLSTDDPVERPLPHPDLLRLHAGLSRVVRGAGAAVFNNYNSDNDNGDDDTDDWIKLTPKPKIPRNERIEAYLNSLPLETVTSIPSQQLKHSSGTIMADSSPWSSYTTDRPQW